MKLVQGFGINDSERPVYSVIDGKRVVCPACRAWTSMLQRAFSEKAIARRPTYDCVLVCDDWKFFSSFRRWWSENYVYGWELDKVILSDEKLYSPSSCIYIPGWLNKFTTNSGRRRGKYQIGVFYQRSDGVFKAKCSNPITGENEHLGRFKTQNEAHKAWLKRKIELANELKPSMDAIDYRIYPRVIEIVQGMK